MSAAKMPVAAITRATTGKRRVTVYLIVLGALAAAVIVAANLVFGGKPTTRPGLFGAEAGFLAELPFYLLLGFAKLQDSIRARLTGVQIAALLGASGVLPVLIFQAAALQIHLAALATMAAIAFALAFWFVIPVRGMTAAIRNLAFLVLLGMAILSGIFKWICPTVIPKLPMEILPHLAAIHVSILSAVLLGGFGRDGIGFVPRLKDLALGTLMFLLTALTAGPIGVWLGVFKTGSHGFHPLTVIGLTLGAFWFVALGEEFFFRGLLMSWLQDWTGTPVIAIAVQALTFGAVHLWFRGAFPNYRQALLAAILGVWCGISKVRAASLQASMVTHALAVATWRVFLS